MFRSFHRIVLSVLCAVLVAAGTVRAATFPTYDQVYVQSGHNSYFAGNIFEPFASGNDQRISDVLLHEHVGMVEFDIKKAEPGRWRVYHTWRLPGFNTQCEYLDDCLVRLQAFQWALPQHEVLNVLIELKETEPILINNPTPDVFDSDHTVDQLDATLRRYLGPALFTPNDFMSDPACSGASTLLECGEKRTWPTTDRLRGKFIVNVSGNWSSNYYNWAVYATIGNGIRARAAFPLRSFFDACGEGQQTGDGYFPGKPVDPALLQRARANSIFWEVSDDGGKPVFLDAKGAGCPAAAVEGDAFLHHQHGVLRSIDSYTADQQKQVIANGYRFIQTDFAWDFVRDGLPAVSKFVTDPTRRFNDPAWARGGAKLDPAALIEPGNRIYLYNYTASDATFHFLEETTNRSVTWEAVVASSTVDKTPDDSHPPVRGIDGNETARGDGCLRAESADGAEWVMICRRLLLKGEDWLTVSDDATRVVISVQAQSDLDGSIDNAQKSERGDASDGLGDMLQMRIDPLGAGATATLASASHLIGNDISASPAYRILQSVRFARPLVRQGLYAQGDKLFVRPRFTNVQTREITLCDLPGSHRNEKRSGVIDFSFPVSCPPQLPPRRPTPKEPYCPSYEAGLCYEKCKPGYGGIGPTCFRNCKPGYSDDGLFCRLDAKIIGADNSACPWYDKCAQGIIDRKPIGWCSTCPPDPPGRHWKNDGCTCRLDVDIYPKTDGYNRGIGWIPGTR
jgi:Phosphoinositide phospholipase C, Ca2+-dependent